MWIKMSKAVVLARPIKPEWLDRTVEMLSETRNKDEIRQGMNEYFHISLKAVLTGERQGRF
jgi:L-rhamnose mutarotase